MLSLSFFKPRYESARLTTEYAEATFAHDFGILGGIYQACESRSCGILLHNKPVIALLLIPGVKVQRELRDVRGADPVRAPDPR